tara:strand:+ start:554 stop:934 length:381 start_codon:yes stop_codon:yes gene_type:complete
MPSEIANKIVDHIFSDEKSRAIDATNDALAAATYDAIQAQKLEFAKQMGFELDQTAQSAADDLEDKVVADGEEGEPKVEPEAQRMPHEPPPEEVALGDQEVPEQPEAELEPTEEQPTEEPEDETDS